MTAIRTLSCALLLLAGLITSTSAQKVKVGYDKGVEFSKYKTYTWAKPSMPVTRPLLYEMIVGSIDSELTHRGLQRTDQNGDLILIGSGGIDVALNQTVGTPILPTYAGGPVSFDGTMWTGAQGTSSAVYVQEGTLQLQFVDRSSNKLVWNGTLSEKLDSTRKNDSLNRIEKGIAKLFKQFPPKDASPR
jgi:hypothetical protein